MLCIRVFFFFLLFFPGTVEQLRHRKEAVVWCFVVMSHLINIYLFRLNPLAAGINLNAGLKADAANKEIEEAMKRVREAQSLISAAIEPGREYIKVQKILLLGCWLCGIKQCLDCLHCCHYKHLLGQLTSSDDFLGRFSCLQIVCFCFCFQC